MQKLLSIFQGCYKSRLKYGRSEGPEGVNITGTSMGVRHNFRVEIKEYLVEILHRSKFGMEQISL